MNWNNPVERFRLIESVGVGEYNRLLAARNAELPNVYPVPSRFGTLFAVNGTATAFETREQAEAHYAQIAA
jgi:hypothetical protein